MSVTTAPLGDDLQMSREMLDRQLRLRRSLDQISRFAIVLLLVIVGTIYLMVPIQAVGWIGGTFLGTFVDHSLRVSDLAPTTSTPFSGLEAGLTEGDRITAINGQPISRSRELYRFLGQVREGDAVFLTVLSDNGTSRDVSFATMGFPVGDTFTRFVAPYIIGLLYLGIGLWVYRSRRDQTSARVFMLLCGSMALVLGMVFGIWTSQFAVMLRLWTAAIPLAAGATMALAMVFPYELRFVSRNPSWRLLPFLPTILIVLWGQADLFATPDAYLDAWARNYYFAAIAVIILLAIMLYRSLRSTSPVAREQARVVLAGSAVAFVPMIVWTFNSGALAIQWVLFAFIAFPFALGYSILRYRLLDSESVASQAVAYTIIGILVTLAHSLLVVGASLVLGAAVPPNNPVVIGVIIFATLLAFNPLRTYLQTSIDNLFFRSRQVFQTRLNDFSHRLTIASGLEDAIGALREQIFETIQPTHAYVFLRNPETDEFMTIASNPDGNSDLRFSPNGALADTLGESLDMMYLEPGRPVPPTLAGDQTRLAVLRTPVLAPLTSQNKLTGWLAIGPKRSGDVYNISDLRFVKSLTEQAALAIERSQVLTDLQRRVRELDVLSGVTQAVNLTLEFDNLLELIHTQTSKVIEADNFYIILHSESNDSMRFAFVLEGNERISERENQSWPTTEGLASEVVRSGRPIRTDNYVTECALRGVEPRRHDFRAWMGAPLNVAQGTLGALVVASKNIGETFTDEQLKIFWAIADQAASAIDKARLFSDAEARARQLATLNAISSELASTLDLEKLLSMIMTAAVEILDAEAGSLLLVDEPNEELVFRVMAGGAEELVGTRLKSGVGLVGAVAKTGKPIIVDDAASDPRWNATTDEDTGFSTRTIVAVPLQLRERIIGVLELLNKRDGSIFNQDDVTMLATFASQAAVAIENAQSFQATDQALTERIDELSMLQRIDRELNTTLEVNRVIQITLDWALRVSGASAGAIGMVNEEADGLYLLASQGYSESLEQYRDEAMRFTPDGLVGRVISTGKPELLEDVTQDPLSKALSENTLAQLSVPLVRVNEVIGVLILETSLANVLTVDDLGFITRLTEHASVAISNARLFQEVEAANLAKTEFVSFVSHELKTPMTSIRGYTDLIMGGQMGEISDMQGQFLGTIRSNVDRMARLVSDLADVSRIESGHLRLETSPITLASVIEETLRSTQGQIEEKSQSLEVDVPEDLPLVEADQSRLVQVMTNLMSNAYKYTLENGQIFITAKQTVDYDEDGNGHDVVQVSVRDTGIGMSAEDLDKLFTKFFRSSSVMGSVPGTGLGLNITKNLIMLHGGRIWVDSVEGEGSSFTYTVPVATQTADTREEAGAD